MAENLDLELFLAVGLIKKLSHLIPEDDLELKDEVKVFLDDYQIGRNRRKAAMFDEMLKRMTPIFEYKYNTPNSECVTLNEVIENSKLFDLYDKALRIM